MHLAFFTLHRCLFLSYNKDILNCSRPCASQIDQLTNWPFHAIHLLPRCSLSQLYGSTPYNQGQWNTLYFFFFFGLPRLIRGFRWGSFTSCTLFINLHCHSAWVKLISDSKRWNNSVACIGETTALAAKRLGLQNVYYPVQPGLEG